MMWRNYLKIAWRNLIVDKTYSFINIFGLTIGLTSCLLVATVVLDEISYDSFWAKKDRLYRILTVETSEGMEGKSESSFVNLAATLQENFPEVEASGSLSKGNYTFRLDEHSTDAIQMNLIQADTNVWEMLDFKVLQGAPERYRPGTGNLVVTESFVDTHFPNESPVGKEIQLVSSYLSESRPFLITGIIADIPSNSYLRAEGIQISKPSDMPLSKEGWGYFDEQMILVSSNTAIQAFTAKVNDWYKNYITDASEEVKQRVNTYEFQPIEDIYLKSDFASQEVKGNPSNVYLFSGVAMLLLMIAFINFVNLSAARSIKRFREIGVRKVLGAGKRQLITQFLYESLLFFLIAALLASTLYALSLVQVEALLGHRLETRLFENMPLLLGFAICVLMMGTLAGVYPAWMVAGFPVGNALKNSFNKKGTVSVSFIRKSLVATQFVFAILVLIGTVTVWSQMRYMEDKDLGYDPSQILSISSFATEGKSAELKQQIEKIAGVEAVSISNWVPTQGAGSMTKRIQNPQDPDQVIPVHYIIGDIDLPRVMGMEIKEGRGFELRDNIQSTLLSLEDSEVSDKKSPVILMTQSTAELLEVTDLGGAVPNLEETPVGIIGDFHSISLRDPIKPTVIMANNDFNYASVLIKVQDGTESQVLDAVGMIWKEFYDVKPFKFEWVDELVNKQYDKEHRQAQLFTFFSGLMLFLASLGVFGLVVHATEQRVKEIGVRKVLGASGFSIVQLFSLDYLKLVLVSLLIASPIAWYLMNIWLLDFAYKISLQWWMFVGAGCLAGVLALATVSARVLWTAHINPVNSLRSE
ncbi:ABC transporter permease [Algoriphagus vanfongensis]|uniref:ABC transporter permease n=1 Tax=Algoriphagus vanfongensis TaxID=426371 RepID=UPI000405511D|nr:ABC transporter permease [Algoriphagus vanfongensis]